MDADDKLTVAVAALRKIESSRADKAIVDQHAATAMYELVGRVRTIAADALREIEGE